MQPFLVFLRSRGRWWSVRTALTIRQIAAQDTDPGRRKLFGHRDQQSSVCVSAGAVGQHQKVAGGVRGAVQYSPHRNLPRRFIFERTWLLASVNSAYRFNFLAWHASTTLVGSMASESSCISTTLPFLSMT